MKLYFGLYVLFAVFSYVLPILMIVMAKLPSPGSEFGAGGGLYLLLFLFVATVFHFLSLIIFNIVKYKTPKDQKQIISRQCKTVNILSLGFFAFLVLAIFFIW